MYRFLKHPPYVRLSEFADGTLPASRAREMADHLERCADCRRELGVIRDADEALRAVPIPAMPEGLFERVLERRANGIRSILPAAPVGVVRRRSRVPAVAAVGTILLAGVFTVLMPSREAQAGASVLSLEAISTDGVTIAASYEPGSILRGRRSVRARARIWLESDPSAPFTIGIGVLTRTEKDSFQGTLELPAGTGYALIALEDATGTAIDVNGGGFWDYTNVEDSFSSASALLARLEALRELSANGLLPASQLRRAAIQATALHPQSLELWAARAAYETRVTARSSARDSMIARHRLRLAEFVRRSVAGEPDLARLERLVEYAAIVEDAGITSELLERLSAIAPGHRVVMEARTAERFANVTGSDYGEFLAGLETDFEEAHEFSQFIAAMGYSFARDVGDPVEILAWAQRLYAGDPDSRDGIAFDLATEPTLRGEAARLLRERLAFYASPPPSLRALHQSSGEFSSRVRSKIATLQSALGRLLIGGGDLAGGLAALEESIDNRWDPDVASLLIELSASGTTSVRMRELERLVRVDPLYDGPVPAAGLDVSASEVRAAAERLEKRLLRDARAARVPDVLLRSAGGAAVPVDDGGVTLLVLWQVPPDPDAEEVRILAAEARRLSVAGVRLLIASPQRWFTETRGVADLVGARPVVDEDGSATDGFGGWDLWEYVVVHDGSYSVHYEVEDATRLALLRSEISRQGR
ncbi:MAG: anti-sigma factor [Gemmatimonadota bacterium]